MTGVLLGSVIGVVAAALTTVGITFGSRIGSRWGRWAEVAGGLVLIQNRNFDAVLARRARWMEPQAHREGEDEWLFLRFYDFEPDGLLNFNIVTLRREGTSGWVQQVTSTPLRPLTQAELAAALTAAGFGEIASYGDMSGNPFDPQASGNLILTARVEK